MSPSDGTDYVPDLDTVRMIGNDGFHEVASSHDRENGLLQHFNWFYLAMRSRAHRRPGATATDAVPKFSILVASSAPS